MFLLSNIKEERVVGVARTDDVPVLVKFAGASFSYFFTAITINSVADLKFIE